MQSLNFDLKSKTYSPVMLKKKNCLPVPVYRSFYWCVKVLEQYIGLKMEKQDEVVEEDQEVFHYSIYNVLDV
jgi:hypothetical protein